MIPSAVHCLLASAVLPSFLATAAAEFAVAAAGLDAVVAVAATGCSAELGAA